MKDKTLSRVLAQLVLTCSLVGLSEAEPLRLGSINFPNSGPEAAQEHFLRGVKYLHSFGFEDAAEAFQAASKVAPDFVMAYWGEALCHNHPLIPERDLESPRKSARSSWPYACRTGGKGPNPSRGRFS